MKLSLSLSALIAGTAVLAAPVPVSSHLPPLLSLD